VKPAQLIVFQLAGALALALGASSSVWAKKEYRDVTWAWCLYDCGNSGDFNSPQEVFDAVNAYINQTYDQCVATAPCGSGCWKLNRYNVVPTGGFRIYNGISTYQGNTSNIATSFTAACPQRAAETIVTDYGNTGGLAAYGKTYCPNGWSPATGNHTTVVINGQQTGSSSIWCEREIPEAPVPPPKQAQASPKRDDGPKACERSKPLFGDPISPIDGSHVESEVDYVSQDGNLWVGRSYSSASARWTWGNAGMSLSDFTGRSAATNSDPLTAEIMLIPPGIYYSGRPPAIPTQRSFALIRTEASAEPEVSVTLPDGRRVVFKEVSPGVFTTTSISKESLSVSTLPDGSPRWVMRTATGEYVFDAAGRLVQRVSPAGDATNYVYSPSGGVTVTSLPSMRSVVYARPSVLSPKFSSATLPDGQVINYSVDHLNRIQGVSYPDGTSKSYRYGEAEHVGGVGGSGFMPTWLTGIIDENGARTVTLKFDGQRALSTERAGGVDKYSVAYSTGTAIVSMPNGGPTSSLTWDVGPDGERRLLSMSQPAGAGCAASSSNRSYDPNGNLASVVDFNQTRTCYAHESVRNLQAVRVEGLAAGASCSAVTGAGAALPASSRKVHTQWHPDWALKTKVAEPGRIVTTIYNGQPDPFNSNAIASCAPTSAQLPDGKPIAVVCKVVEQATTDTTGAQGFTATLQSGVANRVTRWTYNEWGKVLTARGSRTDVDDTITYQYYSDTTADHMPGDLQSVTNARNQVTQFTRYNRHGQVLESVDPNGVLTTNTYDLRQRLLGTTTGGQTTSYQYDLVGQLKRVTLPDQTWVGYDYDDAHRQVAVYDHKGNRTDYVLDNAGNRIGENTRDPSGSLKRQLTRTIDALGRVQQASGRE
jgi:YD repeat-containing protein